MSIKNIFEKYVLGKVPQIEKKEIVDNSKVNKKNGKMNILYRENILNQDDLKTKDAIINSSDIDLRQYLNFVNQSIEIVNQQDCLEVPLKFVTEKIEINGNCEKRIETEYRHYINIEKIKNSKLLEKIENELFDREIRFVYKEKPTGNFKNDSEFELKIIDRNEDEKYLIFEADNFFQFIYIKPNDNQLRKQKDAILRLKERPIKEHEPLLKLFSNPRFNWQYFHQNYDNSISVNKWYILNNINIDGVDEQRKFVEKALKTLDFALLEGPPGSGKTTAIIELILQLVERGKRILLCSSTHVAVDNVIHRILTKYKNECEGKIIPIRICPDKKQIRKKSVEPYRLQDFVRNTKHDLKKKLSENLNTESKYILYQSLENDDNDFDKIILDSANLASGTMIGILQHPDIKNESMISKFDYLIIDESSKVTFLDFLVPALHAKRWIVVGDVNQLSPYIEDDILSKKIDNILPENETNALISKFEMDRKIEFQNEYEEKYLYILITEKENIELFRNEYIENFNDVFVVDENFTNSQENILKLNSADIVLCYNTDKCRSFINNYGYVKSYIFENEITEIKFKNRQKYFHNNRKTNETYNYFFGIKKQRNDERQTWGEMVGSRLSQAYSYRFDKKIGAKVKKELELLTKPIKFNNLSLFNKLGLDKKILNSTKSDSSFQNNIDEIRRIAMPSIMELLQIGINENIITNEKGQEIDKFIYSGFNKIEQIKELKFQTLTYQHRMNDEIAEIPRKYFYEGKNLKTANTVIERIDIMEDYEKTENKVIWISNNDVKFRKTNKNINPTEVNQIENELRKLLEYSKNFPKAINGSREKFEIAVITFYREQEFELRKMLRNFTKEWHKNKHFTIGDLDITLCVLDKYQGDEADVILLSFTKFTKNAFYNSPNRLNVALTRARFKLVLFGNKAWFEENGGSDALKQLAYDYSERLQTTKKQ